MMLWFEVILKLGLVLALIYGSLYLLRRTRLVTPGGSGRKIRVLESTRLAPRQALHLVRVQDQVLLIGASDQGLSLLGEIENLPEEEPDAPAPLPDWKKVFDRQLALIRRKGHPGGEAL